MLCLDPLIRLLPVEASSIVDAEAMVKGVLLFPVYLFLRGSFVGLAWASLEFSARFPTEPISSIRVIACLDRRALPPDPTIISPCLNVHLPTERSSALSFCAPTCQKLANGSSIVRAE
jgi:hypothetical protein